MADRNPDWKPDKGIIKSQPWLFGFSALLVLIGLILTWAWSEHYRNPVLQWVMVIIVSAALLGFVNYFVEREAYARVDGSGRQPIPYWVMIVAWFVYALIVYSTGGTARTERVENCIPKTQLITTTGHIPNPDAYINFWKECKGNKSILVDAPFEDYVRKHQKLPQWRMTPDGYTSDVGGWLNYYQSHPQNPYPIDKMTPDEKQTFYTTRQMPSHILYHK